MAKTVAEELKNDHPFYSHMRRGLAVTDLPSSSLHWIHPALSVLLRLLPTLTIDHDVKDHSLHRV